MNQQEKMLKDPERKKGLLRGFEMIDRDGVKFLKAGALAFLGLIPWAYGLILAVASGSPLYLLICIPGGMIAMPQLCGAADTVMRSMRDEIGWWWWDTYKTAWKRNFRATLLPGAVFGLICSVQIFLLYLIARMDDPVRDFWMLSLAFIVELAIVSYYLPMLVCMELSAGALLRNCFVLFFSHPIKSIVSALLQGVYYLIILIWFPLTSVVFLLTSVWLPMMMSYGILYPALDKHFGLKEAYEKLEKEQWESSEA